MARPDTAEAAPVVAWSDLLDRLASGPDRWRQGEHVSLIGPTGTGKTFAGLQLLELRDYCTVLGTKPRDPTLDQLRRRRWRVIEQWPPPALARRVVLWPRWRSPADTPAQRATIHQAFGEMFAAGGWCVFADELSYLSRELRLDGDLRHFWQQGRSMGLSLVGATQRPAWVPLDIYSAATHLFFWRTNDDNDLRRIGGVGWLSSAMIRRAVATLDHRSHQFLYLNSRTGLMVRSRVEA